MERRFLVVLVKYSNFSDLSDRHTNRNLFSKYDEGTRGAGSFLQKYREYISSPSKPTSLIQCFFDQKEEDV